MDGDLKPIQTKEELEAFERQSDEAFEANKEMYDALAKEESKRQAEEEQRFEAESKFYDDLVQEGR